jgi:hypothetical protein
VFRHRGSARWSVACGSATRPGFARAGWSAATLASSSTVSGSTGLPSTVNDQQTAPGCRPRTGRASRRVPGCRSPRRHRTSSPRRA